MLTWLPRLEPQTSSLLQAALDDRFFRLWEYEDRLDDPRDQRVRKEIDSHVEELVQRNGEVQLLSLATGDPQLMRGTARGQPFDPHRDGVRVAAWRQLELLVWSRLAELRALSVHDPSRADRTYLTVPGLFEALDKSGLLQLSNEQIDPVLSSDPLVFFGNHALFAHPLVRENRELVGQLLASVGVDDLVVRLAVDPNAVVLRADTPHAFLFDYWWGVRVELEHLDDPRHLGATRHERRVDRHDPLAMPLLAVDVTWSMQDDLKVVQVLETTPAPSQPPPCGLIFNRYLHAMRDWRRRRWVHVDGAVKAYSASAYEPAIDDTTAPTGEVVAYRKLWRVDGSIGDEDWGRLLGRHFRGNELVIEAFGSILDERV